MKTKQCNKCKEVKSVEGFSKCKGREDGLQTQCRACRKRYYQANRVAILEHVKQYQQANKESIVNKKKQHYQNNRDAILEKQKQYGQANKGAIAEKNKQYYQDNKEALLEQKKQYNKANRKKINAQRKKRYATDRAFRAVRRLRGRLRIALNGTSKAASTMELVGCDRDHLLFHLESQFTDGMTWNNVHIDHIQPCSSFDLEDEEQQRICFHYTNLQPLFCRDNIIKSDNDPGEHQVRLL